MERKMTDREEKMVEAYKKMFTSEEGMMVLQDLEKYCCFSKTTKSQEGGVDEMVFKEGKRSVILHIMKKLDKGMISIYELLK